MRLKQWSRALVWGISSVCLLYRVWRWMYPGWQYWDTSNRGPGLLSLTYSYEKLLYWTPPLRGARGCSWKDGWRRRSLGLQGAPHLGGTKAQLKQRSVSWWQSRQGAPGTKSHHRLRDLSLRSWPTLGGDNWSCLYWNNNQGLCSLSRCLWGLFLFLNWKIKGRTWDFIY